MKLLEVLRQRRRRIRRNIEAIRLKRIRRHTQPGYTHCMNCGTKLKGMYCHQCGQYALDIYQPIWKYILQYFENMYQFDGKIGMTLRLMFTRPGFLTNEFNEGKINSYVHPFRLYMCISVVFFTLFFMVAERQTGRTLLTLNVSQIPDSVITRLKQPDATSLPSITIYAYNTQTLHDALEACGVEQADSLIRMHFDDRNNELNRITLPCLLFESCMTRTTLHDDDQENTRIIQKISKREILDTEGQFYASLPTDTATGRITVDVYDWMNRINQTDSLHQQATASFVLGQLSKWTPFYLMFLLPLQALIFKISYRNRRYMDHFAHAVHLSSLFLVALVIPAGIFLTHFNMGYGNNSDINQLEKAAFYLFPLALLLYQLVSMHTVYRENWRKTTVKCLLTFSIFNLLALIIAGGLITWLAVKATGRI